MARFCVVLDYGEGRGARDYPVYWTGDREDATLQAEAFALGCRSMGLPNWEQLVCIRVEENGHDWQLIRADGTVARLTVEEYAQ